MALGYILLFERLNEKNDIGILLTYENMPMQYTENF